MPQATHPVSYNFDVGNIRAEAVDFAHFNILDRLEGLSLEEAAIVFATGLRAVCDIAGFSYGEVMNVGENVDRHSGINRPGSRALCRTIEDLKHLRVRGQIRKDLGMVVNTNVTYSPMHPLIKQMYFDGGLKWEERTDSGTAKGIWNGSPLG